MSTGTDTWPTHHENVTFMGSIRLDIASDLAELDANGYRPLRETRPASGPDHR